MRRPIGTRAGAGALLAAAIAVAACAPSSAAEPGATSTRTSLRLKAAQCHALADVTGKLAGNEGGDVRLRVHVDAHGRLRQAEALSWDTRESTARALARGLRACTFEPATQDGVPVAAVETLVFTLGSKSAASVPGPYGSRCPLPSTYLRRDAASGPAALRGPTEMLLHFRPDGSVASAQLMASSGDDALDRAALAAARECRVEASTLPGQALLADAPMKIDWAR